MRIKNKPKPIIKPINPNNNDKIIAIAITKGKIKIISTLNT